MKKPTSSKNTVLLTALCSAVTMFIITLILRMAPFGDNTFLTGDLNGIYINFYSQIHATITEGGNIFYSFQKGFGGSTLGSLAYYCSSPFLLLYVFFEPSTYGTVTTFMMFFKIVLLCVSMAFYLSKKFENSGFFNVIISLCYGFCGYVFIYMQNAMWLDVLILLPLLCHGVDVLLSTKKPFVYVVVLCLSVLFNFYIAFMGCIFIVTYFLYNIYLLPKLSKKDYAMHCLRFGGASLIGGLMSAILYMPAMVEIFVSKGLAESSFEILLTGEFAINEFLARLLPFGFYWPNISGDLPNVYAGLLPLILCFMFFATKSISLKQKLAALTVLVFLFLSMFSTDLMLIFHGGTYPVWFSHRHAFLFVFWLCFLAAKFCAEGSFEKRSFITSVSALLVLLILRYIFVEPVYTITRFIVTVALVASLFGFLFIHSTKLKIPFKKFAIIAVLLLTMGELIVNNYYILNQFEKYPNSEYKAFILENTELLIEAAKGENGKTYRVEKNYMRNLNDGMLLNYYGINYFSSTADEIAMDYLANLGATGNAYYVYDPAGTNIFVDSMISIKYLLATETAPIAYGYEITDISNSRGTVYENPYVFPLVFTVDESAINAELSAQSTAEFQQDVFEALKGEDSLFTAEGAVDLTALEKLSQTLWQNSAHAELSQSELTASIVLDKAKTVLINVPYSEYLQVKVNGENVKTDMIFGGLLSAEIPAGESEISVTYKVPLQAQSIIVSSLAILALCAWFIILRKKQKNL